MKDWILNASIQAQNIMTKSRKYINSACIALYAMLLTAMPAFATTAAAGDITSGINNGLQNVFNIIKAIALPVGVIALGVCGVKILWGNQKSAEEGKSAMIRIVIAMAIIFLGPLLISEIVTWFRSSGEGKEAEIFGGAG